MIKIINVVGARPNFMKIAPIMEAVKRHNENSDIYIEQLLVHTGQHYDREMSESFFDVLGIPEPDINLEVGSASHAVQTGEVMIRFEKVILEYKPDLVVVVGDVNSTIACAMVASKLGVKVAHVEAGLRSFDRTMPEEINRVLTDSISDYLFTTSADAVKNLEKEGVAENKIFFTGNVMIDTLLKHINNLSAPEFMSNMDKYCALTLHRPSNVDSLETFSHIVDIIEYVQSKIPVLFPIHPRTRKKAQEFGIYDRLEGMNNLKIVPPVGYKEFMYIVKNSEFILTDSGGIQEETTVMGIPCLTMRENTERPETISEGTNVLVSTDREKIVSAVNSILDGNWKTGKIPDKWDGKASGRIVSLIAEKLNG